MVSTMSSSSLMSTTRFSSWWCCYCLVLITAGSSVSGLTTTSIGGKNNHYHRRPRLRSNGDGSSTSTTFVLPGNSNSNSQQYQRQGCRQQQQQQQTTSTTLQFSSASELPVVGEMVSTYAYCLKYHYFPTQSMTNAILTVVGDGVAQFQDASRDEETDNDNDNHKINDHTTNTKSDINRNYYDPKRGLVYFFKGLGSGIMWAWWFDMAEVWSMEFTQSALSFGSSSSSALFELQSTTDVLSVPGQTIRTAINILMEQFLVCPLLFSLWDVPVTSLMRGSPMGQVPAQIHDKLLPLLVANAKVWTLVNVVTYNIPLEYRLLFTSAASIVSESINSGITSKEIVVVPETTTTAKQQQQPAAVPSVLMSDPQQQQQQPMYGSGMGASMEANVLVASFAAMNGNGNNNSTLF